MEKTPLGMRKYRVLPIPFLLIILFGVSCNTSTDNNRVYELQEERDSLLVLASTNQRELDRMTTFFDEVAACIDSISEQERLLANQVDIETHRRYSPSEMARRLNQLTDIINGQRQRIASLVDSLNNRVDTTRTGGLRSTISYLTAQLSQKEAQINKLKAEISGQKRNIRTLNAKIENLATAVDELTTQNTALTEAVQVQTEIINEGYILVASKAQLKEMGVIEGGGFLKREKIKLGNVSTSRCNKVNIALFTGMPVPGKKVKLLSPAPAGSYSLRQEADRAIITINDANSFWSLSNIMVVQTQ